MALDYSAFLEARRLALSSPEHVYAYLQGKGDDPIPPGISEALLGRNDSLINLGLARYSRDDMVLRKLFRTALSEEGEALRCAVLANTKCELSDVTGTLEQGTLKAVLESGTDRELQAMFSNRSLKGTELADILARSGPAEYLSHERWFYCAVLALDLNPNLKTAFKSRYPTGYSTGWDDYSHNKALEEAWNVLEAAPLTERAALWLADVFSRRDIAVHFQCDDAFFMRVLERWRSDDPSLDEAFSRVRMWVAANVPGGPQPHTWLANHDDSFVREGYYYGFDTADPEELERCFQRDGHKFISTAVENDNLYREEDVRTRLRKLIDMDCHARSDWMELDRFESRLERLGKQDPDYLSQTDLRDRAMSAPVTVGLLHQALERSEQRLKAYLNDMVSHLRRSIF